MEGTSTWLGVGLYRILRKILEENPHGVNQQLALSSHPTPCILGVQKSLQEETSSLINLTKSNKTRPPHQTGSSQGKLTFFHFASEQREGLGRALHAKPEIKKKKKVGRGGWHFNYANILEHKRERKYNLRKNNKKLSMESSIQDSKTR